MSVKIFYHIYCNDKILPIVKDQITKIIFSGLYEKATVIYCFVTGEPEYMEEVCTFIENSGVKFQIPKKIPYDTTYERYTLLEIPNYITPDDKFLYIHSKGIKPKRTTHTDCSIYENVYEWRNYMEYFLISKHTDCIKELNYYDVAGTNFSLGISPHFSGNFWWSTGKYFLTLDFNYLKYDMNYFTPEMFLFRNNPKYINFYTSNIDHYYESYPTKYYVDLDK